MKKFLAYFKNNKIKIIFLFLYILICLFSFVRFLIIKQIGFSLLSLAYLALSIAIILVEKYTHFKINNFLAICLFIIMCGGLMGTTYNLYVIIPRLDNFLHTLSGVMFGAIGFILFDLLFDQDNNHRNDHKNDNKKFISKLLFCFCFSLAVGYIWEIFEWLCYNF